MVDFLERTYESQECWDYFLVLMWREDTDLTQHPPPSLLLPRCPIDPISVVRSNCNLTVQPGCNIAELYDCFEALY